MMDQLGLFPARMLTVSEINRYLRELFESDEILQDVWISGEISNFSAPPSGHLYFTLKDGISALKCVVWKPNAMRLRMNLQAGLAVEAHGAVGIYERDGQYQLYVDAIRLSGEGALYQEYLRLKARLENEGLFDTSRKRPIPERPQRIGIVTSPTGAALQDILDTIRVRFPLVQLFLSPAAVQGEAAPMEIVSAIQQLNALPSLDVLILARGGGSLEDLWAFNDERVVRAVAESKVPVITGIGHETDFTLSDFTADLRAPTPTAAAMQATPDVADIRTRLASLTEQIFALGERSLDNLYKTLDGLSGRLNRMSPSRLIQNERQALDAAGIGLARGMTIHMQSERSQIEHYKKQLMSLNPLAILQRGFAVVSKIEGEIVRSKNQVSPKDSIQVQVMDGVFNAKVDD